MLIMIVDTHGTVLFYKSLIWYLSEDRPTILVSTIKKSNELKFQNLSILKIGYTLPEKSA